MLSVKLTFKCYVGRVTQLRRCHSSTFVVRGRGPAGIGMRGFVGHNKKLEKDGKGWTVAEKHAPFASLTNNFGLQIAGIHFVIK